MSLKLRIFFRLLGFALVMITFGLAVIWVIQNEHKTNNNNSAVASAENIVASYLARVHEKQLTVAQFFHDTGVLVEAEQSPQIALLFTPEGDVLPVGQGGDDQTVRQLRSLIDLPAIRGVRLEENYGLITFAKFAVTRDATTGDSSLTPLPSRASLDAGAIGLLVVTRIDRDLLRARQARDHQLPVMVINDRGRILTSGSGNIRMAYPTLESTREFAHGIYSPSSDTQIVMTELATTEDDFSALWVVQNPVMSATEDQLSFFLVLLVVVTVVAFYLFWIFLNDQFWTLEGVIETLENLVHRHQSIPDIHRGSDESGRVASAIFLLQRKLLDGDRLRNHYILQQGHLVELVFLEMGRLAGSLDDEGRVEVLNALEDIKANLKTSMQEDRLQLIRRRAQSVEQRRATENTPLLAPGRGSTPELLEPVANAETTAAATAAASAPVVPSVAAPPANSGKEAAETSVAGVREDNPSTQIAPYNDQDGDWDGDQDSDWDSNKDDDQYDNRYNDQGDDWYDYTAQDGVRLQMNYSYKLMLASLQQLGERIRVRQKKMFQLKIVEQELSIAARLQASMLPQQSLVTPKVFIGGHMRPAKQVGGDFYDYFQIANTSTYGFLIADVSGKGVPAGLFMSMAMLLVRNITQNMSNPADAIAHLNNMLVKMNSETMFITMVYGTIDTETGVVQYCNAGHDPILHQGADGVSFWETTGDPIVCVIEDISYSVKAKTLLPGERLVLFTDGVTEAMNNDQDSYGADNLLRIVDKLATKPIDSVAEGVLIDVDEFAGAADQHDDITLLVIEHLA